jgi:hypothetical protein
VARDCNKKYWDTCRGSGRSAESAGVRFHHEQKEIAMQVPQVHLAPRGRGESTVAAPKNLFVLLAFALLAGLCLAPALKAGDDEDRKIFVGKWTAIFRPPFEFKSDGTMKYNGQDHGTWAIQRGKMTFRDKFGPSRTYEYKLTKKDTYYLLEWTDGGGAKMVYEKAIKK